MLNLRALRTLVEVERVRSFAVASDRLGYTLPAVSIQLKKLEQDLDVPLFDRSLRPPALTPQGRRVAEHARAVLAEIDAIRAVGRAADTLEGSFRVGFVPTASVRLMPHFLTAAAARHPHATFVVESGLTTDLARRVGEGELDAALATESHYIGPAMRFEPLFSERFVIAIPGRAATWSLARCAEELLHIQLLRPASRVDVLVAERFAQLGLVPRRSQRLDSVEVAMECVNAGFAFSILPEPDVLRYAADAIARPSEDIDFSRTIGLVTRGGGAMGARHDALVELLRHAAQVAEPGSAVA